jgi:hypothetical protein
MADRLLRPPRPAPDHTSLERERWDESSRTHGARTRLLIICICILSATLTSQVGSASLRSLTAAGLPANYVLAPPIDPNPTPNATISVQPNATVDLNRSMRQITIQLALSTNPLSSTPDVPPFNNVQVLLSYDPHNLTASSLDYSTNVFTQTSYSTAIVRDCLDGNPAPGQGNSACGSDDGPGFVSFAESILGGATPDGTIGNIFSLTLNVNPRAPPNIYQIQIKRAILGYGNTPILTRNLDGYYITLNCGGQACRPAVAKFTWYPQPAKQNQITTFYGNGSLPSTNALIKNYSWTFGDTQGIKPYRDTGTNSTASYLYQIAGNYTVTLKITDTNGASASTSKTVNVINADVDMGIQSIDVQPSPIGLQPGVVFTITAVLKNYGGVAENTSMTLTLSLVGHPKLLGNLTVVNLKPSATKTLTAKWDSTGYSTNVYRVDGFTPVLKNETITDNNHKSYWIQLIPLLPTGSLDLLSTAGISVLVVGAGGFGASLLRKRNRKDDDAL